MAKPRPASPSSRVYVAFGAAALFGLSVFAVWWLTEPNAPRPAGTAGPAAGAGSAGPGGTALAIEVPGLLRGGSLTGSIDPAGDAMARLTHAPLVRINRSTDLVEPWLAESWTTSADNLTYTLKLRPNLRWSDGTPFTSEDVVPTVASVQVMGKPLAARAIDPLTIEVQFPEPFAPGLRVLDRHPILPRHAPSERVGLGPFVDDRDGRDGRDGRAGRDARILVRNPHYWRKAPDGSALPYLDQLNIAELKPGPGSPVVHDFADSAILVDDYEALKKLEQEGKIRLFDLGPGLDADALWFAAAALDAPSRARPGSGEPGRPWLTSEIFRLAISAAVDRREYCKQVYFGACDPMAGPVSPANAVWFNPDLPLGRGDQQLARTMLVDLGLRDRNGDLILDDAAGRPVRFSLLIRRGVPSSVRAATFLTETLRGAGVGVTVTALDAPALRARRMKGDYDAIYDRMEIDDTDPAMNLDFWLSSGEAHVWNPARPSRPADWERQIDQLMLKQAATFNRSERLQAFVEVQRIYNQHMPALFFGAPHVRVFTSPRALNATPSPLRPHVLWNADSLAALK